MKFRHLRGHYRGDCCCWLVGHGYKVAKVCGGQRVRIGVGLQGEDFGQSVEKDPLSGFLLLDQCVLSVVQGFPQLLVEVLVVQELGFLLQRCTLLKTRFLGWKWWVTKVASLGL